MTATVTTDEIAAVVAAVDFGKASARKRGRDPRWPYVPVIEDSVGQSQILRRAFATRDEAVDYAQRHLDGLRESIAARLALPNMRALREQYGLPREIA